MKQSTKYVRLDAHQATIGAAIPDDIERVIARSVLPSRYSWRAHSQLGRATGRRRTP